MKPRFMLIRRLWSVKVLAGIFALLSASSAFATCSSFLGKVVINEYNFHGNYIELKVLDPTLTAGGVNPFAGWKLTVWDSKGKTEEDVSSNYTDKTQNICRATNNYTYVKIPIDKLGNDAIVALWDSNGGKKLIDLFRVGQHGFLAYPPSGKEYEACGTIENALSSSTHSAPLMGNAGNKDLARLPDGTGPWVISPGTGNNSEETPCAPNDNILQVTKTPSSANVGVGSGNPFTWTISVKNGATKEGLSNVTLSDTLPTGMYLTTCPTGATCGGTTGAFTSFSKNISALTAGATQNISATAYVTTAGTYTNTAEARATELNPGYTQASGTVITSNGIDHYEIDLPPVGLTCQSNTITVRACASSTAPCTTSLATTSATTTLSTSSGNFTNAGGATQTFTGSTNYALSATAAATVTIGITNPSTTPNCYSLNGTTRTLLASCSFQVKTAAFIFSVPDFSAGDGSGNITISAQQEDDATKKCVSFTPSGNVKMWTDYLNPATGTKQATLTHGSDYLLPTSAPASGNVPLVFNSSGQASISLNYWDAGKLRLNAQWNQVTGYSDFVVKPYFVISDITCSDLTVNPAASGPAGAKFCRAGESFSATVKAVAANRTTTTPNFGRETPAESVKLTTALVSPVGGENPALLGSLAKDAGDPSVARSTSLSWGEVGIISLTPGIDDGDYLGAGNVTADAVARVGRFYPHHFATATTPPMECPGTAPAFVCPASNGTPANGMAYAGQTFTASITSRNASGGTTQNYDKDTGYANAGGVAAYTAKGGAAIPSGAASGSLSGNAATANDFIKGKATLSTAKYTFTTPPGTASDIYLRASETSGDAVTSLRNPSSDSVEGGLKIAQGRLRLINAFGNGKQPLKMQAEVQFWSGTSWVRNNKDSTALTQSAIIVSDPAKLSISNFTFSNGSGEITLTATTAGSYDVSANLGATGAALASCTSGLSGGSAANVPWLRSRNGTCTASDSFAADPTARATFGVYAPESKKTIHVREFY